MSRNNEHYRKIRESNREIGKQMAVNLQPEYMYGCIFYWTEGSKGNLSVDFTNSDVFMVKYFLNFLKQFFGCKDEKISIFINAYLNNGLSSGDIENYWLKELNLPSTCLRKFTNRAKYYDPLNKRIKSNHPYGICKLRVHDCSIVEKIFGSIEEKFGVKINLRNNG